MGYINNHLINPKLLLDAQDIMAAACITKPISLTTTKKVKVKISEEVYFSFLYHTFDSPGWILKSHGKNVYHVSRCVPLSLSSVGPYPRSH
jgi:hypothetical protein